MVNMQHILQRHVEKSVRRLVDDVADMFVATHDEERLVLTLMDGQETKWRITVERV